MSRTHFVGSQCPVFVRVCQRICEDFRPAPIFSASFPLKDRKARRGSAAVPARSSIAAQNFLVPQRSGTISAISRVTRESAATRETSSRRATVSRSLGKSISATKTGALAPDFVCAEASCPARPLALSSKRISAARANPGFPARRRTSLSRRPSASDRALQIKEIQLPALDAAPMRPALRVAGKKQTEPT